jgi:DNA-binding MarR family transcriptional regulator
MSPGDDLTQLLKSARRIGRALDIHSRRIDREVGLTLPQFIVLQCIQELGEVTSRTLSAAAGLSPPTVVGVLDKLEAKGLIHRYRSTNDRRVVHTEITARGRSILGNAPQPLGKTFAERFMALPGAYRADILGALRTVADLADDGYEAISHPDEAISRDRSLCGEVNGHSD